MLDKIKELLDYKNYIELKKYLTGLEPEDIAIYFEELSDEERALVFRLLNKDIAAEVFVELDSDLEEELINLFTDKELKEVLNEIFLDDTADLIEEMPANVVKLIKKIDKRLMNF